MNEMVKKLTRNILSNHPETEARIEHGIELHRKGTARFSVVDQKGVPLEGAQVSFTLNSHDFDFGANGFMYQQFKSQDENDAYEQFFKDAFNLAVVPFYWSDLEPVQGKPRFAKDSPYLYRRPPVDALLEFCKANNIRPKGHPLVWHSFKPEWINADDPMLRNLWERHVREIAQRYGDQIQNWDVVNEVVNHSYRDNPHVPAKNHAHVAFDLAQRYLPESCRLNYNDYAVWGPLRDVYTPVYMLVESLKLTGHRVGGLGLQYHMFERDLDRMLDQYPQGLLNQENVYDCLDTYAGLGVPLNISEITISAREDLGDANLEFQALVAERLYKIWFSHPAVNGIVYWNIINDTAHVSGDNLWNENFYKGGLITRDFQAKPAYHVIRNLIKEEWTTKEIATFDPKGDNYLRGFYGTYDVEIKLPNGLTTQTTARLIKDRKNVFTFKV